MRTLRRRCTKLPNDEQVADLKAALRRWAGGLKAETYALYLAGRDPRVPLYIKLLALCVVAYALSPIDLIPDFIPGLGHLDDLILVPLGIALVVRMIPDEVLAECRERARGSFREGVPGSRAAAGVVVAIWVLSTVLVVLLVVNVAR